MMLTQARFPALVALLSVSLLSGCQQPAEPQTFDAACALSSTPIANIQGRQADSPLLGEVHQVRGVVIANWSNATQLGGLFIHSLSTQQDQDPQTSEGLFIDLTDSSLTEAAAALNPGSVVTLRGTVTELNGRTQLSALTTLHTCGNAALPAVTTLQLPISDLADFEALENMPVQLSQTLTITGHYGYTRTGQIQLAPSQQFTATQRQLPGAAAHAANQQALLARLVVDDNLAAGPSQAPTFRSGDQLASFSAVLQQQGRDYLLQPLSELSITAGNPRPTAPPAVAANGLRIAAFNVLNYFNGEGDSKTFPTTRGAKDAASFALQEAKIVAALHALQADVIGLMEIENDGYGSASAIAQLTAALRVASGQDWQYIDAAQAADQGRFGSDQITNGLLYRADKVQPFGTVISTSQPPFGVRSRPPLVQRFQALHNDELFAVAVNHFKSKGSCPRNQQDPNADQQDGQGCWNPVRTESAELLAELMATAPLDSVSAQILLGDFNAYAKEDPIRALEAAGFHNRIEAFEPNGYSYVFNGFAGSLDHILVSQSLYERVINQRHWSINADEPVALQYDQQQGRWAQADAFRSSDHDPVYIDVQF